jgi:hypothetical protein
MAIAMVQEFEAGDDRSTLNYDAIREQLNVEADPPAGMIVHTAGFTAGGVFRIFDVWETRADGERFMKEKLEPIIESLAPAAAESGEDFVPPTRESWYELHDSMAG